MLITIKQAAKLLGASTSTLERLRRCPTAHFPAAIKLSANCVRYDETELLEWIKSRKEVAA